ncbi:MAG: lipase family protein [Pseudomonadota bacterium]
MIDSSPSQSPLLPLLIVLAGLSSLPLLAQPEEDTGNVSFDIVHGYVERAQLAYASRDDIKARYPHIVRIATPANTDVLYFLELNPDTKEQIISIRGTDNLENALQDAEYLRAEDSALGIAVHRGFDEDARKIYADLKPYLRKDYETFLTGHSLGAAISTLLMLYMLDDGFDIRASVNFGQPKLTNITGAKLFADVPLLRVVDANDVVPLLPADTLLDSIDGQYAHFGRELILLSGPHYSYLTEQQAMQTSKGSFWMDLGHESLEEHKISRYVAGILDKLQHNIEVGFEQREQFAEQPKSGS